MNYFYFAIFLFSAIVSSACASSYEDYDSVEDDFLHSYQARRAEGLVSNEEDDVSLESTSIESTDDDAEISGSEGTPRGQIVSSREQINVPMVPKILPPFKRSGSVVDKLIKDLFGSETSQSPKSPITFNKLFDRKVEEMIKEQKRKKAEPEAARQNSN